MADQTDPNSANSAAATGAPAGYTSAPSNVAGGGTGAINGNPPVSAYRQVTTLSIAFMLVFTAYSSAQNYATSRDKTVGSTSLGILYAVFTFSNIVASAILQTFGAKACLILGAMTYGGFVGANIEFTAQVMYPMSAVIGFGAAILWTAQGSYVTRASQYHEWVEGLNPGSSIGGFNGTFWSIFQISQFGGNLLVALLFHFSVGDHTVFLIMTCVCFAGALLLFAIKNLESMSTATPVASNLSSGSEPLLPLGGGSDGDEKKFSLFSLIAPLGLLLQSKMLLIVPAIIYSGVSQGFMFGDFPPMIDDKQLKFFVMAVFGAADVLSSIVLGKLSDRVGRKAIVCVGFVVHMAAFVFLRLYTIPQNEHPIFFAVAIAFGLGDGVFNTQLYAIVGVLYEDNAEAAFACFKFLQAGSTAAAFLYDDAFGIVTKLYIVIAFLAVAVPMIFLLDWAVVNIDGAGNHKRKPHRDHPDHVHAHPHVQSQNAQPVSLAGPIGVHDKANV